MSRRRLRLAVLVPLGALLAAAVASTPAAAAGYDSVAEALIRNLHRKLLAVAITLAVMVEVTLFYAALKFHGNDDPKSTAHNRRLEIAWTVGVAVILLFVGASSYLVLADLTASGASGGAPPDEEDVNVRVVGQNWFWTFSYPDENVTTRNTLVLPANRTVRFSITAEDVIHAVHIPELGIKQDAVPGRTNVVQTRLTSTGTYRLYCAEFCGTGHSKMLATVRVVSPDEYRSWLRQQNDSVPQNRSAS